MRGDARYDATVTGALEEGATVGSGDNDGGESATTRADESQQRAWNAGSGSGGGSGGGDALTFLGGLALGAAAMYFLDPDTGRRRRALVKDQAGSLLGDLPGRASGVAHDVANRARGVAAIAQRRFGDDEAPSDETIVARVRSRMGRLVSHPGAVTITSDGGRVTLSGAILQSEVD